MRAAPGLTPRLLLGLRSLSGPTLATRDRLLEVVARYREPESLAVTLAKAVAVPVDGVLTCNTPALRAALAELQTHVPLVIVVPAISEYERQDLGAGLERVIEASRARVRAARLGKSFARVWHPALFGHGDFAWRLPVLIESELAGLRRRQVRGLVLDAWFTDLALAAGNRRMFQTYTRYVQHRIGVAAGFETRNLGTLLAQLREWQIAPDFVTGPINPSGLLMKPSPEELLAEVRRGHVPVVARELCAGGVDSLDAAGAYAIEHGAYGLAPELTEMDDVGAELKALRHEGAAVVSGG